MTTPTTPVRLPGDPIPPPPEPRYPWRVAVMMFGLVALVLLVVWLGFQAVRGPATSGQFPTAPTATAYALAFQATVSAADTAEPRPTRPPTPVVAAQPAVATPSAPSAASSRASGVTPPQAATNVAAGTGAAQATTAVVGASAVVSDVSGATSPSQVEPARTAGVAAKESSASPTETPIHTVSPDLQQAVGAAYNQYWQVKADAFFALDPTPLSQVATGPELTRLQKQVADDQAADRATRVKTEHDYVVLSATGSQAQVADDYRDLSIWVDPSTHEPLPGESEPASSEVAPEHKVVYDLVLSGGTWKVNDGVELATQEATQ